MENNYDLTKSLETMSEVTNQYFPKISALSNIKLLNILWIKRQIICEIFKGKKVQPLTPTTKNVKTN